MASSRPSRSRTSQDPHSNSANSLWVGSSTGFDSGSSSSSWTGGSGCDTTSSSVDCGGF